MSLSEEYAAAARGRATPKRVPVLAKVPLKGIKASRLLIKLMQTLSEDELAFVMQENREMVKVIQEGCLEELERDVREGIETNRTRPKEFGGGNE